MYHLCEILYTRCVSSSNNALKEILHSVWLLSLLEFRPNNWGMCCPRTFLKAPEPSRPVKRSLSFQLERYPTQRHCSTLLATPTTRIRPPLLSHSSPNSTRQIYPFQNPSPTHVRSPSPQDLNSFGNFSDLVKRPSVYGRRERLRTDPSHFPNFAYH